MARELEFQVPSPPFPGAAEDLARLLETLHTSGTLRTLNDLFARFDRVTEVGLDELNSRAGRGLVGAVLAIGEIMTRMPVDNLRRVASGVERGIIQAGQFIDSDPPSSLQVFRMMRQPDTRRALGAMLTMLQAVGAALDRDPAPEPPAAPKNET